MKWMIIIYWCDFWFSTRWLNEPMTNDGGFSKAKLRIGWKIVGVFYFIFVQCCLPSKGARYISENHCCILVFYAQQRFFFPTEEFYVFWYLLFIYFILINFTWIFCDGKVSGIFGVQCVHMTQDTDTIWHNHSDMTF